MIRVEMPMQNLSRYHRNHLYPATKPSAFRKKAQVRQFPTQCFTLWTSIKRYKTLAWCAPLPALSVPSM